MKRSLALFAPAFALAYGLAYAVKLPVFIYYPLRGELTLEPLPPAHGPGMLWYGWLVAGSAAGLAGVALVPAHYAARMPPSASWIVVAAVMALVMVDEWHWFVP